MRKVKVALDCDISHRIVGALESLYADRGFEFVAVDKLVPAASTDDHWAAAFKRFGGEVTLSADTQIAVKPHKVLSFIDNGFQSFFLQSPWSRSRGHVKAAHVTFWWPTVERKIAEGLKGRCWRVPCAVSKDSELRLKDCELEELKIPHDVLEKARRAESGK